MTTITSACPVCGDVADRDTYDIGSGPELACATCEWCWGADGQPLQPLARGFGLRACPRCGSVSHHPTDQAEGYCGRCHDWTMKP